MQSFLYSVWFRDELAPLDDQDREWVACYIVEASTASEARGWGDHLAHGFARRRGTETFLWSEIGAPTNRGAVAHLPLVQVGHEPTDAELGW